MRIPESPPQEPKLPFIWATALYSVATMTLAYPAVWGGFLVTPVSDQYIGGYPVRHFAAEMLTHAGRFPLWNPYIFGGMPYVAAMHGDIFYPTFLLRMLLPTDVAMTWAFVIHVFLCGLFMFGFLRVSGIRFYGALIGGLAYMMSGNIAGLVSPGHDGKLYVSALFPLTLWLLVLGIRVGRDWVWGGLALVLGLAVLTPHPQVLQYMLLACGAFSLFLAFGTWEGQEIPRRVAVRRLAFAGVAVVLGFAIGAIQYLPVAEYVAWSPRSGGLSGYEVATSYSMPPEELINSYLPQFSGILFAYWGRNFIHFHSDYLGATVLMLAGAAFGGAGPTKGKGFRWFWLAVLCVALFWAFGGFTPFYRIVYWLVPGTKFFRAPSTILYIVSFCVALFAALGTDRFLAREVAVRYLLLWVIGAVIIAILASAGLFTGIGSVFAGPERQQALLANASAVTVGAWRSFLFVALLAGIVYATLYHRFRPSLAIGLLPLLVMLDLWSIERLYWQFSPRAAKLYAADPTIEYILRQPQPGRVLPIAPDRSQAAYHDPFLFGDALMIYGVRNALGYHGNHIARYGRLGADEDRLTVNSRFWQLANVKYLLTNLPNLQAQGLHLAVGPVQNAAGTTVYLYDVPGENPLAWVVPAMVKAKDDEVLGALYHPNFDLRSVALFDTAAPVRSKSQLKELPKPLATRASVKTFEPGHIVLDLDEPAPAGSALVVSENYYPGWQASVDGKAASLGRADLSLIGVELPAGGREVELRFESQTYRRGRAMTLVAIGLSVIWGALGFVVGRPKA